MGCFGTCCKVVFLFLTAIIGLTGLSMVFYGGVNVFEVSLADATLGKVTEQMTPFIKCTDQADAKISGAPAALPAGADKDKIRDMLVASCTYQFQSPSLTIFMMAGVFSLFALMSGLIAGCREVKGNLYAYTVLSAVAIALLIVSIGWMANVTAGTVSKFAPCDAFNDATITALQEDFGYTCVSFKGIVKGEDTHNVAVSWSATISVFYAGAILTILSLLSFLSMNSCASQPSHFSVQKKKQADEYTPLSATNAHNGQPRPGNQAAY